MAGDKSRRFYNVTQTKRRYYNKPQIENMLSDQTQHDHSQYAPIDHDHPGYAPAQHNHDHGSLTGLADDDHPHYHTDARADARYSQLSHNHAHNNLTGLTTGDPHTQYHTDARGDARYTLRTSANRPGVTKLYRRDSDDAYNVQTHFSGGRWILQGYYGDSYHAPCQVDKASRADEADIAGLASAFFVNGTIVYSAGLTKNAAGWYGPIPFNATYRSGGLVTWNASVSGLQAQRNGWYMLWAQAHAGSTRSNFVVQILHSGTGGIVWTQKANTESYGGHQALAFDYFTAGQYAQMKIHADQTFSLDSNNRFGMCFLGD